MHKAAFISLFYTAPLNILPHKGMICKSKRITGKPVIPNRSTVLYLHRFRFHKSTEERGEGKKKRKSTFVLFSEA